ncbi:Uncharacterized protein AC506_4816 [Pseudomonas syringae pv. maculicola str. M6]|nr:Uncharacterized protein AC506_4816 [Pseudomonas syringae pv. maculicola str. M6]
MFGHRLDHIHDLADLVAFLLQQTHGVGRATHFVGQTLDLGNRFAHHLVAIACFAVGVGRCLRGLLGVTCHFCNRGRHLVHGRGHLIGFDFLAVDAGAGLFGNGRQLFGGTGDLYDTVANPANQLTQRAAHALNTLLQHTQLVTTSDRQGLGQVAGSNAIDHCQGFLQWTGNLPGDDHGCDHAQNDGQQRASDLRGAGLRAFLIAAIQLQLIHGFADFDDVLALYRHFLASQSDVSSRGLEVLQRCAVGHQRGFQLPELIGLGAAERCFQRVQILDGQIQFCHGCLLGFGRGIGGVATHLITREPQVFLCISDDPVLLKPIGIDRVHFFYFILKQLKHIDTFAGMRGQFITRRSAGLVPAAHIIQRFLIVSDHRRQLFEHFHVLRALERGQQLLLIILEAIQRDLNGLCDFLVAVSHHVLQAGNPQFGQL